MIRRLALLIVFYLLSAELLAWTSRTVLDPGGHVDVAIAGLTVLSLVLRLLTMFVVPFFLAFRLLNTRFHRPKMDR